MLLKRSSVLRQVGWDFFGFVKSLGSSGALDLAGGNSLGIFVATTAFNEHLDLIRVRELCFKNNSWLAVVACVGELGDFSPSKVNLLWAPRGSAQPCLQEGMDPHQPPSDPANKLLKLERWQVVFAGLLRLGDEDIGSRGAQGDAEL